MANPALGAYIARRRKELSLTQEMLAEESGLSVGYIGTLESGYVNLPKKPTREKLARALRIHPNDISAAAGVIEPQDDGDEITQEDVDREIRRLKGLPIAERMEAVKRYSPALYELLEATVFDLAIRGAQTPRQPGERPSESERLDSPPTR